MDKFIVHGYIADFMNLILCEVCEGKRSCAFFEKNVFLQKEQRIFTKGNLQLKSSFQVSRKICN